MVDDTLTERARLAVLLANQAARGRGAAKITCLDLLLGLVREEESLAADVLAEHGVGEDRVVASLGAAAPPGEGGPVLALEAPVQRAVERAVYEARWAGRERAATEHLLLGLLHEDDGPAVQLLLDARLREEDVREAIAQHSRRRR